MSILSLAPAPLGDDSPLDRDARTAGIADAYDDHTAGTPLDVLEARLGWMTSNLRSDAYTAYVMGYAATVISIRLHQEATTTAQTGIAFEDHDDQENQR